jgi:peptide/nickel transport system substrate-binding protein
MRQISRQGAACSLLAAVLFAPPALAADLRVGLSVESSAVDPHLHPPTADTMVLSHVFQPLAEFDATRRLVPRLAVSWKTIDPLTWEFELRKGVKWHDGSDFTAEDVKFSVERALSVPNGPALPGTCSRQISGIGIVGPHAVRLAIGTPCPLPADLAGLLIVSKRQVERATAADYDRGRATIGTGPYRHRAWKPGERVVLERHPDFWGRAPAWDSVEIRFLPDDAKRVAALRAAEVQLIDAVPIAGIAELKQDKEIRLASTVAGTLTICRTRCAIRGCAPPSRRRSTARRSWQRSCRGRGPSPVSCCRTASSARPESWRQSSTIPMRRSVC